MVDLVGGGDRRVVLDAVDALAARCGLLCRRGTFALVEFGKCPVFVVVVRAEQVVQLVLVLVACCCCCCGCGGRQRLLVALAACAEAVVGVVVAKQYYLVLSALFGARRRFLAGRALHEKVDVCLPRCFAVAVGGGGGGCGTCFFGQLAGIVRVR